MPLVVRDGNNTSQNLPNNGIDKTVYVVSDSTITASATSATDVYQFKGAAGVVARLRRIELWSATIITGASTFASTFMKVSLKRSSAAGTTGAWTQLNTSTTYGSHSFANAASAITVNVAGNTAFTVGTVVGTLRQGYLPFVPSAFAVTTINPPNPGPLLWTFGSEGYYPPDLVGTADYIVVNLGGVTPIGTIAANLVWEEATF